jgi:hypothetical protein
VVRLDKAEVLNIIKNTFYHLIVEENLKVGSTEVLLYFPSMKIAILESSKNIHKFDDENVQDMNELLIKKTLGATPIYLNMEEPDFSIGFLLNEILMETGFY